MARSQVRALIVAYVGLGLLSLTGCSGEQAAPEGRTGAAVSNLCASGATVNAIIELADASGQPVDLTAENTVITVETRAAGGDFQPAEGIYVGFDGPSQVDLVLVADNSGSQEGHLEVMQEALRAFGAEIIDGRSAPDRVGLVRVSTDVGEVVGLTEDLAAFEAGVDQLYIKNGWTSLWDGLRLGNEALEGGATDACQLGAYRALVGFTDGKDNDSDTTKADDVRAFTAGGATTAVHLIGVGDEIDEETLSSVAADTGGQYASIADYAELLGALSATARGISGAAPISFQVAGCDQVEARITVQVKTGDQATTFSLVQPLPAVCAP